MLKRRRHFNHSFALRITVTLFVTIAFMFVSGCGYYVFDKIDDYNHFLNTYEKYQKAPVEDIDFKRVNGFTPLIEQYFDYGKGFSSETAFVKTEKGNALLTIIGTLIDIDNDFTQTELISGKYAYENEGKYGVKDVLGREIVPPLYDKVQIIGDTVLAISGKTAKVYVAGSIVGENDSVTYARLIDESFLYNNGNICDLNFNICTIDGYKYMSVPKEERVVIKLGGFYGYYNIEKAERIGERYIEAMQFCEGFAVVETESGDSAVINSEGNVVYKTSDKKLSDRSGKFMCYVTHSMYGVLDSDFNEVTDTLFEYVKYEKAVGERLIVKFGNGERLYSLNELKYEDTVFDSVDYNDGIYFCKNGKTMLLYDDNLDLITECDDACMSYGILMIKEDDKYSYYKRTAI